MRALIGSWLAASWLAVPSVPAAQTATEPPGERGSLYVRLLFGAYDPTDDSLDGFHAGTSLEATLGYSLAERAALELAVGRYLSTTSQIGTSQLALAIVPVTLSLALPMRVPGAAIYLQLGLGVFFTRMDLEWSTPYGGPGPSS